MGLVGWPWHSSWTLTLTHDLIHFSSSTPSFTTCQSKVNPTWTKIHLSAVNIPIKYWAWLTLIIKFIFHFETYFFYQTDLCCFCQYRIQWYSRSYIFSETIASDRSNRWRLWPRTFDWTLACRKLSMSIWIDSRCWSRFNHIEKTILFLDHSGASK